MSINWVMTSPNESGFIKLPNERILFTSPPRTSLQISTPNTFPAAQPFKINSDSGVVYITNQRIVYLPANPTTELQSFSSPILNLQDSYVRAPFFGANYWCALCKPVSDGGIPPTHPAVELRLTFKDGGAFDFHTTFEQIKERVHQAYSVAREHGQRGMTSAELPDVHLEQLPAYEPATRHGPPPQQEEGPTILSPIPVRPGEGRDSGISGVRRSDGSSPREQRSVAPDEPPPGYEEAQAHAVGMNPDERLRDEEERGRESPL